MKAMSNNLPLENLPQVVNYLAPYPFDASFNADELSKISTVPFPSDYEAKNIIFETTSSNKSPPKEINPSYAAQLLPNFLNAANAEAASSLSFSVVTNSASFNHPHDEDDNDE